MNQEFFTNLPSEIIINILSRLPVRTIIRCKCVCKSWLDLLETREFAKSHVSKSAPGLAVFQDKILSKSYKIYEFEDALDLELHELHYNQITNFDLPYQVMIHSSANGLVFLCDVSHRPGGLLVCNPITRDYIEIQCPQEFVYSYPQVVTFGFGASKMTGQHKAVRIFHHHCIRDENTRELVSIPKSECRVYTLGTGSWRSIAPGAPFVYICRSIAAFLNGNLHWLVFDLNGCPSISCFDLETELFSTFSTPLPRNGGFLVDLFALEDCLCLCDNSSDDDFVIWLMKEYGVEKSWTKEFVIRKSPDLIGESYDLFIPIKVFNDGDILMAWEDFFLFYYSNKTKTTTKIDMIEPRVPGAIYSILHTSSFLSLKSFAMENVSSF